MLEEQINKHPYLSIEVKKDLIEIAKTAHESKLSEIAEFLYHTYKERYNIYDDKNLKIETSGTGKKIGEDILKLNIEADEQQITVSKLLTQKHNKEIKNLQEDTSKAQEIRTIMNERPEKEFLDSLTWLTQGQQDIDDGQMEKQINVSIEKYKVYKSETGKENAIVKFTIETQEILNGITFGIDENDHIYIYNRKNSDKLSQLKNPLSSKNAIKMSSNELKELIAYVKKNISNTMVY